MLGTSMINLDFRQTNSTLAITKHNTSTYVLEILKSLTKPCIQIAPITVTVAFREAIWTHGLVNDLDISQKHV